MSPAAGQPFRLVQISDCHLAESATTPYRGKNADAGLQSLLPAIVDWRPQLILLTGDVSEDASPAAYGRVAGAIECLDAPICALPGNHDDDAVMSRYFSHGPWAGPLAVRAGEWQLLLLKSSVAGRIDGAINPVDLGELGARLRVESGRPVLVALHHQPVVVGAAWIDRYMLQEPGRLLRLVEAHQQVRGLVWGHVHQAFASTLGRAQLLSCPSTAVNSLPATRQFQHDPAGPACRWLLLHADGLLETGLLRGR
jgi:3',5'-cyclic-AMP phosphodiesterase